MRSHVVLYVNGVEQRVGDGRAFDTLSDFLRLDQGLTGTKIVCAEGDCGACTVLVGRPREGRLVYEPINACIALVHQLDGAHVVTVEGLKRNGCLSPVQEAMIACHGSQCGFCTPGFVVAMTALFEHEEQPVDEASLRAGLTGNLCRCTGYIPILRAGCATPAGSVAKLNELYADDELPGRLAACATGPAQVEADGRVVFLPTDLAQAAAFKAQHPDCTVVSGATDLGVRWNKGLIDPRIVLDLTHVTGCDEVAVRDGALILGGRATWAKVERFVKDLAPEFYRILTVFGSPQIRNAATVAGNIANASPIADCLPFLFVTGAVLELVSPSGARSVNVNDFYLGYKKIDLRGDELIARVRVPLPTADQRLKLYKVSKRRDLDISTFTAGVLVKLQGERIVWARLAYGGVAPVVLRLPKTEAFLAGQELSESVMRQAGRLARTEIKPISDVRGCAEYRYQLAENILVKFYFDTAGHRAAVAAG